MYYERRFDVFDALFAVDYCFPPGRHPFKWMETGSQVRHSPSGLVLVLHDHRIQYVLLGIKFLIEPVLTLFFPSKCTR